jgi:hypothetical protein
MGLYREIGPVREVVWVETVQRRSWLEGPLPPRLDAVADKSVFNQLPAFVKPVKTSAGASDFAEAWSRYAP